MNKWLLNDRIRECLHLVRLHVLFGYPLFEEAFQKEWQAFHLSLLLVHQLHCCTLLFNRGIVSKPKDDPAEKPVASMKESM
mmetsp:Transcript_4594/g.7663  ORF Transcript_4594/g.7663 Transcript_4594/m.7663 type:complete len:81 (-) Transcript_4594:254-496(-)